MHYHYIVSTLLAWPSGILLGNLLANIVWSAIFEWRLRAHTKRTREHFAAFAKRLEDKTEDEIRIRKGKRGSSLLRDGEQTQDSRPKIGE